MAEQFCGLCAIDWRSSKRIGVCHVMGLAGNKSTSNEMRYMWERLQPR
jgi:hypothetical protein